MQDALGESQLSVSLSHARVEQGTKVDGVDLVDGVDRVDWRVGRVRGGMG